MDPTDWIALQFFIVGVFGGLLGYSELVSRYRDQPDALRHVNATWVYLALNAAIGMAALAVLHIIDLEGLTLPEQMTDDSWDEIYLYQMLIAGFGGAAFFRTSIAKTRIANQEIGIGPSLVIDSFLAATDREIDRSFAQNRAAQVPRIVDGIGPAHAATDLTELCIGAMQNLSAEDANTLRDTAAAIAAQNNKALDKTKPVLIGYNLTTYVGPEVVAESARELRRQLSGGPGQASDGTDSDGRATAALLDIISKARKVP